MRLRTLSVLILSITIITIVAFSQQTYNWKPNNFKIGKYDDLLNTLKQGDKSINFFELRMAFTQTPGYRPYDDSLDDNRKKMFNEFKVNNFLTAIKYANRILDKYYIDPYAHFICEMSYKAMKDTLNENFHAFVRNGIMNSIMQSGDGKTAKTAHLVITTREEFFTLYIFGLTILNQTPEVKDGIPVELVSAKDIKTGDTLDIYFNVAPLIDWSDRELLNKRSKEK